MYCVSIWEPWCWIKVTLFTYLFHIFLSHGWVIVRRSSGDNNSCQGSTVKLSHVSKITNVDQNYPSSKVRWLGWSFLAASEHRIQIEVQHTQKRRDREGEGETDGSPALFVMQMNVSQCDKCTVKGKTTKLFHLSQYSSTTTGLLIATLSHEQRPD